MCYLSPSSEEQKQSNFPLVNAATFLLQWKEDQELGGQIIMLYTINVYNYICQLYLKLKKIKIK